MTDLFAEVKARALRDLSRSLVLSALISAMILGCSRHSGHGRQEPGKIREAREVRRSTSTALGPCPVRFFRTCEFGFLSDSPAALHAEAGLVAHCDRIFDLVTGEYLGVLKPSGRLLALISGSQALFAPLGGGLRLLHGSEAAAAADSGGSILDWALSPDRSLVATIEIQESVASGKPLPAPEIPLAAQVGPELVVRRLPSLRRIAGWHMRRGAFSSGEPSLIFVDDHHVAYVEEPTHVTRRSLVSEEVEHWPIPDEPSLVHLSGSARALLVERNDGHLTLFGLWPPRQVAEIPSDDGRIVHSAVASSLEWLLTATDSALHVYRRTPSGFELRDTLRVTASAPIPTVDGNCVAVALDDGVFVAGLDAPLLGGERADAQLNLARAPGSIFVHVPPEPTSLGARAHFRAADDERTELMIEALPRNLITRRELADGQGWARTAVEYAARAEPSKWLEPGRLHAAWTTPEGYRAVEFRMGLRPGESCFDHQRYVRVQETEQALLFLQMNVPLGAEPERVQALLEAGFDELLGPLPVDRKRPPDTDDLRSCP